MESRLQLPIADSPIKGLQYLAYPLCILLNYDECLPWFYSNYIQILWNQNSPFSQFTIYPDRFSMNPWLDVEYLRIETLVRNHISIHSLIKECLDNQQYIFSKFDQFYVPNRRDYETTHFVHDFLLHGYDLNSNEYFILGYNENQVFGTTKISFSKFEEAVFSNAVIGNDFNIINKKMNYKYDFDPILVCELLDDYLNGKNTSERFRVLGMPFKDMVFGVGVYKCLKDCLQSLKCDDDVNIDLRPLHMLYEHKKCMSLRIKYMIENNYLDKNTYLYDNAIDIENKICEIRNLLIKYNIHHNNNYLDRVTNYLTDIEKTEKIMMEDLLNILSKKIS